MSHILEVDSQMCKQCKQKQFDHFGFLKTSSLQAFELCFEGGPRYLKPKQLRMVTSGDEHIEIKASSLVEFQFLTHRNRPPVTSTRHACSDVFKVVNFVDMTCVASESILLESSGFNASKQPLSMTLANQSCPSHPNTRRYFKGFSTFSGGSLMTN